MLGWLLLPDAQHLVPLQHHTEVDEAGQLDTKTETGTSRLALGRVAEVVVGTGVEVHQSLGA